MGPSLRDWGGTAFRVASFASAGAFLGPWGIAIGAAIGVIFAAISFMTGKEQRIRNAQAKIHEKIEEIRAQVMRDVARETKDLMESIRKDVEKTTLTRIDAIHTSLVHPLSIIQQQIELMSKMENQLEKMPHGTIEAI